MSKSNSFENSILLHIFQNADIANIGDATGVRGSTTAGSLYVSLHTADPGEAGSQNTSEISYTGYARVAVARSSGGWTVTGNTVTNAAAVTWPISTGGTGGTPTYFAVGTSLSGAGVLLYSGTMTGPAVSSGVTPYAAIGDLSITED